jgi:hypothetical protein
MCLLPRSHRYISKVSSPSLYTNNVLRQIEDSLFFPIQHLQQRTRKKLPPVLQRAYDTRTSQRNKPIESHPHLLLGLFVTPFDGSLQQPLYIAAAVSLARFPLPFSTVAYVDLSLTRVGNRASPVLTSELLNRVIVSFLPFSLSSHILGCSASDGSYARERERLACLLACFGSLTRCAPRCFLLKCRILFP